jgi:hypothetical protein
MPRIPEVDPSDVGPRTKATLDAQAKNFGAPLNNHLLYAHNDEIFRGVRGMWSALDKAALLDPGMASLINRRVAALVGCVF